MTAPAGPFVVTADEDGQTVAAVLKRRGLAETWNAARRLVERGKLFVGGAVVLDPASRVRVGDRVELRASAPRPREVAPGAIVYDDQQLVVFDKPAGFSSVPYEERETGTAMDLIRAHWRNAGQRATDVALHVVHRIDKDTSGLLLFAKTKLAERMLAAQFREHTVERTYLCVVHGTLTDRRIESRLVEDRGDGLRGSTRDPKKGKRAVTHVRAIEALGSSLGSATGGDVATLCEVRLETGKTHQIRIHLAENGHPLVGERVYIRDYTAKGNTLLDSPRLLLHAATLGFLHPVSHRTVRFESPLPEEFTRALERLRRAK